MPPGTPPAPAPASPPRPAGSNTNLPTSLSADQSIHPLQEILNSPSSALPFAASNAQDNGAVNSSASSIHGGSSASISSESGESVSSLGGLNHVNDGVSGSTVQRKMSRVYSNEDFIRNQVRRLSVQQGNPITIVDGLGQQQQQQQQQQPVPLDSSTVQLASDTPLVVEKESCWKTWLRRKVPAFGWLISPGYKLTDLPDDLIAGITISTVVIPQSMAYAMLAPLPPVYGLYTSVVPILIYCIFGTSRHMHTGTFAITTLLLGQAVRGLMAKDTSSKAHGLMGDFGLTNTLLYNVQPVPQLPSEDPEYEREFIGMILMLSFVVGFVQVIMSFLRIGGWASKHLLPDALVGGFNTAAVFHIGTSQLKHFLGIKKMPSSQGAFALLKSWMWIATHFLAETNWHTVLLGTVAIVFMVAMRKVERKRKTAYELQLRKKEMLMVQERQAVSAAIARAHEEQRDLQRRREEQQGFQKSKNTSAKAGTITVDNGDRDSGSSVTTASTVIDPEQGLSPPLLSTTPMALAVEERQIYIPVPDILMAVILLTVVNVVFSLDTPRSKGGWGIDVIGPIPKGLPEITFPANRITSGPQEWMTLNFLKTVVVPMLQPALLIAVIVYVMSFSIAKQFGKRYGYKVDANQEMLALGLASMGGPIFSGYACTGSLTRTAILSQSGGRTPLASMVGVATVTLTLICLTWCFERVPNAVLAAIVLVALQSLVMQITEPLKLWRLGQQKAAVIWTVTFVCVLIVSVELGIAIGIATVLLATAYSWVVDRHRGDDEPLMGQRRHRRPSRRLSRGAVSSREGHVGDATDSLLNNSAVGQRRRSHGGGVRLSEATSPVSRGADWKRRMMRTKWGQKIGSFFGMERPIFSDALQTNTDEDEY
ncbi:sulfate transporter family-domain-containing protein [Gamsiella multidivaricata]|uniref:sulfate transporter family-domain-containing protein n=1 Tax=Gamsiella multidivaricata TaxID=101098 RepID=UPI002220CC98|nr:sulfate transporter family-domain-containing protein [Gamsiella multidivaricata]KAG0365378.1 hypothetical protein BGZ54_006571 [Gamsiella multidivaricata]KAI7821071.1 sulfate transporter family-domain-containing protein [Gamsiella multidivaricata]